MCSEGGHAIKEHFNLPFLILKVMNELRVYIYWGGDGNEFKSVHNICLK